MTRRDYDLILLGVVPILVLTFLFFWGLGGIARLAKRDSGLGLVLAGGLVVLLSGYAVAEPYLRPRRADVVVGAKNFTAGRILSEILRIMLESHTDLTVELMPNLGSKLSYQAILKGDIDVYPEYTGNLLTGKDALDLPVPADRSTITPLVRQEMSKQFGLAFLDPFGLNDTYVPCTTKELARTHGLKKIGDLRKVPEFQVAVDLEFTKRPDGWQGMLKTYDLHFRRPPMQLDPGLLYQAMEKGQADVVIGFASDWQIEALGLVGLEDDRDYFPSYIGAPLVREALLKKHPEVATVLNRLRGQIDDAAIRRMNYEVVQRKRSEADVAREFLKKKGLIK
jgi:osmoprotectant transport system substrate-binding protein